MVRSDIPKILFFIALLSPLFHWNDFAQHFYVYLTGSVITSVIQQQWLVVAVSIAIFVAFLVPLSFRRKAGWAERSIVVAFFVSLFVEMYGIPLTIFFASNYLYHFTAQLPVNVVEFSALGVRFAMDLAMTYALALIVAGMALVMAAWVTLYRSVKKGTKETIVKTGIYSYSRHPQYLGFLLIVVGWFIGWPTILTVVFAPILVYKYVSVCQKEEHELGKAYGSYKKSVPFFL